MVFILSPNLIIFRTIVSRISEQAKSHYLQSGFITVGIRLAEYAMNQNFVFISSWSNSYCVLIFDTLDYNSADIPLIKNPNKTQLPRTVNRPAL